jgi:Zn-dependent protease with chaperone function
VRGLAAQFHDPASGRTQRVQLDLRAGALHVSGDGLERDLDLAALTVAGGGWQGDAVHLVWQEDGRAPSLTLAAADAAALSDLAPEPLAGELRRLVHAAGRARGRGRRVLVVLAVLLVLPLVALAVAFAQRERLLDAVVRRLPTSVDEQLGKLTYEQIRLSGKLVADGPGVDAVRGLGQRLLATAGPQPYQFRFEVLRDPSVNAFAAPGGLVVVHTGLLAEAESADELSGVLAHEIAHVLRRHSLRQIVFAAGLTAGLRLALGSPEGAAQVLVAAAGDLTKLRFGREQESDADRTGLDLLHAARLSPQGLVRFFERLHARGGAPPALLSSHPPAADRAAELEREIARRGAWPVDAPAIDWTAVRTP